MIHLAQGDIIHTTISLPHLEIYLSIFNEQRDVLIDINSISPLIQSFFSIPFVKGILKTSPKQLIFEIYFLSRQKTQMWHKKFFQDPTLTDCMTFPLFSQDESSSISGSMCCICPYTAQKAIKSGINNSLSEELSLYLCHTLLHFLGFDDINEEERKEMRKKEALVMSFLKKQGTFLKV